MFLVVTTISSIIFLTFFSKELPDPISNHFHVDDYYYYSIPVSLIIALVFLNYFAIIFGSESRLRKEALNKDTYLDAVSNATNIILESSLTIDQ